MRKSAYALLLAGCVPAAAATAAVPLIIDVRDGDPVQSVEIIGDSGLMPLARSADGSRFTGSISVEANGTTSQPMMIDYPDFHYPVVLRVYGRFPSVEFPVGAKLPASCTQSNVVSVEADTDDLQAAISKSIQAARLASIEGDDSCDARLHARAIAAKFRNARRMAQLSKGLFVVPDQVIAEYQALNRMTALAEVKRYQEEAIELQAVQLVALRDDAQREGDLGKAAAIQQTIANEAQSSEKTAKAFSKVGVTKDWIADSSAYLSAIARPEAAAAER